MTFSFLEHKVSVTIGVGGGSLSPPNFSRGKMFLFNKYKAHAVSQVPVILHLIQVEVFREISH